MAKEPEKGGEEEGGEFADFLADVSQEIAQRVESLDAGAKAPEVAKKTPRASAPEESKKAPADGEARKKTPAAADAGLIVEWPNIVDRIIEEMR